MQISHVIAKFGIYKRIGFIIEHLHIHTRSFHFDFIAQISSRGDTLLEIHLKTTQLPLWETEQFDQWFPTGVPLHTRVPFTKPRGDAS